MAFKFNSLPEHSDIIDVRSESEYAADHVPGAVSLPVLTDAQRHEVGLLHKSDSFAARRLGMGLVAGNVARMAEGFLRDKDRSWRPLVYCWRGGMRSESLVTVMRKVGWRAEAVPGGYKAYRRHVIAELEDLPGRLGWVVLRGPTGAGKTLLLAALSAAGSQCLDLEALANHRGSLFGSLGPQPTQRMFESKVLAELSAMDPSRPVFVESESRMVGRLRVPAEVVKAMRAGRIVDVDADVSDRARLTARDYGSFRDPGLFREVAEGLVRLVGRERVSEWNAMLEDGRYVDLAKSMLEHHYDPSYARSLRRGYGGKGPDLAVWVDPCDEGSLGAAAAELRASVG